MRRTSWLAVLVLCGGLAVAGTFIACGVSPAVTVVHLGPGEKSERIQGDPLKLKRSGQEAFTGLRGGYHVVRSLDDWRAAWPGGGEPPALPITLDVARSMLLLAAAESKDTAELHIDRVVETADRVHVWVRETKIGENCSPKLERAPFDAVVSPRVDKPVKFYVDQVRGDSCGEAPGVSVQCRVNDTPRWAAKVAAQPGDAIDCEMSAASRGKFALIDNVLSLGELPPGSSAKLAYARGPGRGAFTLDVFGAYTVRAEASDEMGRRSTASATIDALPPKTNDVLVQLVWTNFDVSDDPETFPRVKLRAFDGDTPPKAKTPKECSLDKPRPELCEVKSHSAYTQMKLKASDRRVPLEVVYLDERFDKGPLVCVQLYRDGARTGETCDRAHRDADERWAVGVVEMDSGVLASQPGSAGAGDAGAADAGAADAGAGDAGSGGKKPAPKK
jgi:hypothetical protein